MNRDNAQDLNEEQDKKSMQKFTAHAHFWNILSAAEHEESNSDGKTLQAAWDILDDLILNKYKNDFVIQLPKETRLFRARVIRASDYSAIEKGVCFSNERLYGYNWNESKEPPSDHAEAGRTNHEGEPALYMASDELTACMEVRPRIRQMISVARFQALEDIQIVDFSKIQYSQPLNLYDDEYNVDSRKFLSEIRDLFVRPVYEDEKEKYNVSQMIVDHFRKEHGIQGFAYKSFYAPGTNYTFFDDGMRKFRWEDSRVVNNYAAANLFVSLDKTPEYTDIRGELGDIAADAREDLYRTMDRAMKRKDS